MAKSTPATLALDKAKIAYTLHEYDYDPNAARIGMQAAEALGIEPARLLKTLMAKAGNETGALSSMLKYYGTELNKRRAELMMSIAGSEGLKFGDGGAEELAPVWLRTKANSIEGGTSEIQLNIISKHVLKLPGA